MIRPPRFLSLLCLASACLLPQLATAAKQTVCTITINSADEQKAFRKFLPADKYDFVELVERNRPDWLGSACEAKVSCDMLVISGHYGEGNEFFSDVMEIRESLSIGELERVSCSGSCPNLFANLKEVYLFGCDTLNPNAQRTASAEIVRSLVREGRSPAEAVRLAREMHAARGESSRDRMRLVFKDVPVIYGFSSAAPLGPVAASSLNQFFQSGGASQVGKGHVSGGLLRQFSAQGLASARGMTAGDSLAGMRKDVCMFADDRLSEAQRLQALHELMQRPTAQARLLLDRVERYTAGLDKAKRQQPEVAQALARIAADGSAKDRYLAFARDADEPRTRARMVNVAHALGWLSPEQRVDELALLFKDLLARKAIAPTEVDLACAVNKDRSLDKALQPVAAGGRREDDVGHSAVRACLGGDDAHDRTLEGLVSTDDADVRIAQVYLRHRPIADASELRTVTRAIAAMNGSEAQTRALDVLARHYLSDREIVSTLQQLFARTRSSSVQNAIAGVLIRADADAIATTDLLRTLRENRLKSSSGGNMVEALIQRLQLSSARRPDASLAELRNRSR
ncbi:MAG TPA: hypothetical protein VF522_20675 [Ramlibacter sp.]|uniref:hypothetical protein n=1 Tax=Ramlibacter sp. TaxID=1917967 RepID=UPI002ED6126C